MVGSNLGKARAKVHKVSVVFMGMVTHRAGVSGSEVGSTKHGASAE